MNRSELQPKQNFIHLEQIYKDIDEHSSKFFQHHYQHYLDKNSFPEDVCSIPQEIDLSAATILLGELKWDWTEIERKIDSLVHILRSLHRELCSAYQLLQTIDPRSR